MTQRRGKDCKLTRTGREREKGKDRGERNIAEGEREDRSEREMIRGISKGPMEMKGVKNKCKGWSGSRLTKKNPEWFNCP